MKTHTYGIKKWLIGTAIAATSWLATFDAQAAVPQVVNHQGRLYDSEGAPVTETQVMTFALYDVELGGEPIWSEEVTVDFDDGYFSVRLGEATPLDATIFDGSTRWLGVTVGLDAEMFPRADVASVPYAMFAGDVRGEIIRSASIFRASARSSAPKASGSAIPAACKAPRAPRARSAPLDPPVSQARPVRLDRTAPPARQAPRAKQAPLARPVPPVPPVRQVPR